MRSKQPCMASTKVPLHVSNHKAYVWDADDASYLRKSHHILGYLIGTLPSVAQQNVFLGLPLQLMPEEVVLLVENEVAVLLDNASAHQQPTEEQLSEWKKKISDDRQSRLKGLEAIKIAKGKNQVPQTEEVAKKRREREAKRAEKLALAASVSGADPDENELFNQESVSAEKPTPNEQEPKTSKESFPAHTIIIPGTSNEHPWFQPNSYETLESARVAGIWNYPSTVGERAKCAVYRDLIEKGYFLGGGLKFGGDWLVYPGDLLRYHSHFVASVLPTPTSKLTPMQIVAHGRLGTGTKKAHLFCGWDDEKKEVDYYSIEWANFG